MDLKRPFACRAGFDFSNTLGAASRGGLCNSEPAHNGTTFGEEPRRKKS